MENPFLAFNCDDFQEDLFAENKQMEQHKTSPVPELKIKRRRITHTNKNFGRGANHPSFFLRKFFSKLPLSRYQRVYEDAPHVLERVLERGRKLKGQKSRFNLQDLEDTFGRSVDAEESYLNAKMFFKAISEQSLEMIMEESKCSQVLNHLISIEKYSSRLANPLITARVEFQ